jgi:hypothetical protein
MSRAVKAGVFDEMSNLRAAIAKTKDCALGNQNKTKLRAVLFEYATNTKL